MDLVFPIAPTHKFWSSNQFESLFVGICFPYARYRPWQVRSTPKMFRVARDLRAMFKTEDVAGRSLLRKLLLQFERIPTLPEHVVWSLLYFRKDSPFPFNDTQTTRKQPRKGKKRKTDTVLEKTSSKTGLLSSCKRR